MLLLPRKDTYTVYKTLQEKSPSVWERANDNLPAMAYESFMMEYHVSPKWKTKIILPHDVPESNSFLECMKAGVSFVKLDQG